MAPPTIGHYRVTTKLGEGGMGEVWRATDSRLHRDVAIKVLPAAFANDASRMARLAREAQVLASLNHPGIAAIYGLEDRALVMELVEGPTLADRIAGGALPLDEALAIAAQIADALEFAHERAVVHRDLKPANIKVTLEGKVKVLDFGLAKAVSADPTASSPDTPTLTSPATLAGTIIGTAAYMSPEQARGRAVDRRADIWSFGVVLYEMVTGQRLFTGDTVSDVMANVLKEEPSLTDTPPTLHRLLRKCLQKDPRQRLRDIGDWRELLESASAVPPPIAPLPSRRKLWTIAAAATLVLAAGALTAWHLRPRTLAPLTRFQLGGPGTGDLDYPALSPDGRTIAYVADGGRGPAIWVRALDGVTPRSVAGTDNATYPFWSPDGASLGFFAAGKLQKIRLDGSPPQLLCDASSGRGGAWGPGNVILFSASPASPILEISADGGTPTPLTHPHNSIGDRFPYWLPDGHHFLFSTALGLEVGSVPEAAPRLLLADLTAAQYAPPGPAGGLGHLLFLRNGVSLMAQAFDPGTLRLSGGAVPLAENVPEDNLTDGEFSVSASGNLIVVTVASLTAMRGLIWIDRAGKNLGAAAKPRSYGNVALSPDGTHVATNVFPNVSTATSGCSISSAIPARV